MNTVISLYIRQDRASQFKIRQAMNDSSRPWRETWTGRAWKSRVGEGRKGQQGVWHER